MKEQIYHFIGIGGIGMSGLARILLQRGVKVTGSDVATSYVTDGLIKAGAKVIIGHSAQNVLSNSTVVYSTDIKSDNPELQAAKTLNLPILHRSELLNHLIQDSKVIAIAGTHGKTTTTALLASVLIAAGHDPGYAVGGVLPQFETNASHGEGECFVIEADESDGTFLNYTPFGAILTNIGLDHLNHYGSEEKLIEAFKKFADKVISCEKHLFWCGDDQRLQNLKLPGFSYGTGKNCSLIILRAQQNGWSLDFDISFQGKQYTNIFLPLIGQHNVLNAAAVFGIALALGVTESDIRKGFSSFKGVKRRCERKGELGQILFLDDYAHHPTEIATTLQGIKTAIGEKRLIAVFQPHRYSRTQSCLGSYGKIFNSADILFVTDIFAAGEKPIDGLSGEVVFEEIGPQYRGACFYVARKNLAEVIAASLNPHDLVVTLGAGDITKLSLEIIAKLQA